MDYKQCLIIRSDLKLTSGKVAVQLAHAAVAAYERSDRIVKRRWYNEGQKKVALKVPTLKELYELKSIAEARGLVTALVVDAGLTEVPPGTVTALGIGPEKEEELDKVTSDLKLL
ncbi:MAG: peptidyl-tRNA hydrolase Pth2 [Halobacteriota archaeon]